MFIKSRNGTQYFEFIITKIPNYHKLQVPNSLVYAQKPLATNQLLFKQIIDRAEQGNVIWSEKQLDILANDDQGLKRCAEYWVFCVRFFVASRNIQKAQYYLNKGFVEKAQPEQALLTTQKFLQQLIEKLGVQIGDNKPQGSVLQNQSSSCKVISRPQSSSSLLNLKPMQDIREFWKQSQTLTTKKSGFKPLQPDFIERLEVERKLQDNWDWNAHRLRVLSALDQIKGQ